MKFDFFGLRKSVTDLVGNVRTLRAQLEDLRRKREDIATAPCTRDDAIAILHKRLDVKAQEFIANFQAGTLAPVMRNAHKGTAENYTHSIIAAPQVGVVASTKSLEDGIAFALNDLVKEGIARAVRSVEWPENAIPLAERSARLAKLDAEIADIEREESGLTKHAAELGVTVS